MYKLTEKQRRFLKMLEQLHDDGTYYSGYSIMIGDILDLGTYTSNQRSSLKEIRQEYIQWKNNENNV